MTQARVDHLVVVAATLDEGVAWCEATLGVTPGPGGQHPLMATHNRLLRIATVDYPRAYFEIIAPDPAADASRRRAGARWFDMDDGALMDDIATHGPRLVHAVANVPRLADALAAWKQLGIDRGEPIAASRMTDRGLLQWTIAVRPDGQRLFGGTLPTLIEWGGMHPAAAMPESGIALHGLAVRHPQAATLQEAFGAIGLAGVTVSAGPPQLRATLLTPRGTVVLDSKGL
jgi:hypothetical protein